MCAYITLPLIKKGKWKNSQGLVFTSLPLFLFALWWQRYISRLELEETSPVRLASSEKLSAKIHTDFKARNYPRVVVSF